jgi:hypothetical protein
MNTACTPDIVLPSASESTGAPAITRAILRRPDLYLLARWNWKSALLSAIIRSALFLRTASIHAFLVEFFLALALAGFLGAFAQAYRNVQPRWLAIVLASGIPLALLHLGEFAAGAPRRTFAFSVLYSVIATAATVSLMKRGIWLSGEEQTSLAHDLKKLVSLHQTFLTKNG